MLTIGQQDHTREIPAQIGDEVEIVLFENPGAGYRWVFKPAPGVTVLENRYESMNTAVGSGGHRHLQVRLDQAGRRELGGRYQRPWEKQPAGTVFTVTFVVSD
jgi:predicted secreted protein